MQRLMENLSEGLQNSRYKMPTSALLLLALSSDKHSSVTLMTLTLSQYFYVFGREFFGYGSTYSPSTIELRTFFFFTF